MVLTKSILRQFNYAKVRRYTRRVLSNYLPQVPEIEVALSPTPLAAFDVRVIRKADGFRIETSDVAQSGVQRRAIRSHSVTWIYWLHQADPAVKEIVCDTSDGDWPGFSDFAFASFDPAKVLLPDPYFFRHRGYQEIRQLAADNAVDWNARRDEIVWRGSVTGLGLASLAPSLQNHPGVIQRLRMATHCIPLDIDFRFVPGGGGDKLENILIHEGLIGDRIPTDTWLKHKFAIDIDGFSNAWDNLFHRLLMGCCVLKVGSNYGFKQWYYDQMEPFRHYVPVRADMTDLEEKIDWVRSHDKEAREIAANGQALANSLTWEKECARAGQSIEKRVISK